MPDVTFSWNGHDKRRFLSHKSDPLHFLQLIWPFKKLLYSEDVAKDDRIEEEENNNLLLDRSEKEGRDGLLFDANSRHWNYEASLVDDGETVRTEEVDQEEEEGEEEESNCENTLEENDLEWEDSSFKIRRNCANNTSSGDDDEGNDDVNNEIAPDIAVNSTAAEWRVGSWNNCSESRCFTWNTCKGNNTEEEYSCYNV